jgi:acetylornithine deacetylase/succinyl-diaminopimelate desuccinylase-like protein
MTTEPLPGADAEVLELAQALIRVDTSNFGDHSGPGERKAAELVASWLSEAGLDPVILESHPGRASTIARISGTDSTAPALVVHGHLDVVPAEAADWSVDPFAGEVIDDVLWGRGAVDMKDADAMILAAVRHWARTGQKPRRDIVLAFFADEEAGGKFGAHWLVANHPELFEGATEAIGEVGGFSYTLPNQLRLYLVEAAEKGIAWMKVTGRGRAGHGSMINDENAVTILSEAIARIGRHEFPITLTDMVRQMLTEVADAAGTTFDENDPEKTVALLGPLARMVSATLRDTVNPTILRAGYKTNVIPQEAVAYIDGRFVPGHQEQFVREVREILGPDVDVEVDTEDIAVSTPFVGSLADGMRAAIREEDPEARVIPYTVSGGTDLKSLSLLGITGYGFTPLRLPPDLDFMALFHGINERVPVDALQFGARVLDRFLLNA